MNNKKIVLIIEDEEMLSSMYKTKLEQSGYTAIVASDGLTGIELAVANKPNLILLDVILPQLDGFSVLTRMKEMKEVKNIPVMMLTNLGTQEDINKGEQLGAHSYFVKAELTPAEISVKVDEYFKNH